MSNAGTEVLEELRRRRALGDSRVTPQGRELFERLTTGDLADAFADDLDEVGDSDPMLFGTTDPDE